MIFIHWHTRGQSVCWKTKLQKTAYLWQPYTPASWTLPRAKQDRGWNQEREVTKDASLPKNTTPPTVHNGECEEDSTAHPWSCSGSRIDHPRNSSRQELNNGLIELWRTYWKNEWILPPMSQQKWMEVSVTIRKNSVDDAISYEQRVGQESCDELLLARKQWEFSCNLKVRWSGRVPKSSWQENRDRRSPKKTEKRRWKS